MNLLAKKISTKNRVRKHDVDMDKRSIYASCIDEVLSMTMSISLNPTKLY